MTALPDTVEKYSQSRAFTETTTPANFQKHHATRPGVWGKLVMESGSMAFEWETNAGLSALAAGDTVVIPPETPHRVILQGPVSFFVEFYRSKRTR